MITEKFKSETLDKTILPGRGNPKGRILVIGSHPSGNDCKMGEIYSMQKSRDDKPFVLNQAKELLDALNNAGMGLNEVYVTTMCKHGIGSKPKPKKEDIAGSFTWLDEEINEIKPDLIIALGAEVFKRVMKKSMKSSDFLGEIIDCPYGRVLCNHSPGAVSMDPRLRDQFAEIFQLAKDYVLDDQNYTPIEYYVIDEVEEAKQLVASIIENEWFDVGYDLEWRGKKWIDDEVVYSIQISVQDDIGFVFDISKDGVFENRELLDTLKPLFEHPRTRRMGWNIRADEIRLRHRGFNLPDEGLYWDGMKAMAFFDSRWSKGLEQGIKKFTNYEPYYVEFSLLLKKHKLKKEDMSMLRMLEPEAFFRYCAGDAVAHRTACLNQIAYFPKHHWKYFTEVYMPLSHYFTDLEYEGIELSRDVMDDIREKYVSKYNELSAKLQTLVEPYLSQLDLKPTNKPVKRKKGDTSEVEEFVPHFEFNPNSSPQKKKLLFEVLGLTPAYYTKAGKSPKPRSWYDRQSEITQRLYSPSTNGKSLSTLVFELTASGENPEALELVQTLLNLGRVSVFANKFFSIKGVNLEEEDEDFLDDEENEGEEPLKQSYYAAICSDGRIHSSFVEILKNFRASSRINVQNPASKVLAHMPEIFVPGYSKLTKAEQKANDYLIPKNLRNIFGVGKREDWCWAEADIAGAEIGICAYICRDEKYIADVLSGNFHVKKMHEYFNDTTLTKEDTGRYICSKTLSFRTLYSASLEGAAEPIQSEIFAESGVLWPLETLQYALSVWKSYSTYMAWREMTVQSAMENFYVENIYGIKYWFAETTDPALKGSYSNEALSFSVSSVMALFSWDVAVAIKKECVRTKEWMRWICPVNAVHDALYFTVHKDMLKDNYFAEMLKYYFTEHCKIPTGDTLGVDISIGKYWKDKNPIFAGETKWNPIDKNWVWK